MNTAFETLTADFNYSAYQERQLFAITHDYIDNMASTFKCSNQFVNTGGEWHINDYRGFAVVSMVENNPDNGALLSFLDEIVSDLNERINLEDDYFFLPEDSYHQTIANTLSDKRYIDNIESKGLDNAYHEIVGEAFSDIVLPNLHVPVNMSMVGLTVFGSCIAMLGTFDREKDYDHVYSFRKQFYNSESLKKLGIRWTRPFVGHITLAYLGREIDALGRILLARSINAVNVNIRKYGGSTFHIAKTELRKYDDLSCFQSMPEYPEYHFVK